MFLIRNDSNKNPCLIRYFSLEDEQKKEEKLRWFATTRFEEIPFEHIKADGKGNWIDKVDNDFDEQLPLVKKGKREKSIFNSYAIGVSTNRDEWVFDFNQTSLVDKIKYFIKSYNSQLRKIHRLKRLKKMEVDDLGNLIQYDIKWSDSLKKKFIRKIRLLFNQRFLTTLNYRPYVKKHYYYDKNLSDRLTSKHLKIFGTNLTKANRVICFSGIGSSKPFAVLGTSRLWSLDFLEKTQGVPLLIDISKKFVYNVTDWGLRTFQEYYDDKKINAEAIFYYVYAVLHNREYRKKYELNLRRELPRIPLFNDFWQWVKWGEGLMTLHVNYSKIEPYKLKITNRNIENKTQIRAKLKVDKKLGRIILDDQTILEGVPNEAWEYKLGNRSAIEWILDQYKEKSPRDPIVRKKFNTYKFQDYKEQVIDLLQRVIRLSIETMRIIGQIEKRKKPE